MRALRLQMTLRFSALSMLVGVLAAVSVVIVGVSAPAQAESLAGRSASEIFAKTAPPFDVINYLMRSADPSNTREPGEGASPLNFTLVMLHSTQNPEFAAEHVRPLLKAIELKDHFKYPNEALRTQAYYRSVILIEQSLTVDQPNRREVMEKLSAVVLEKYDQTFLRWKTLTASERLTSASLLGLATYNLDEPLQKRVRELYAVASVDEFASFMTNFTTLSMGAHFTQTHLQFAAALFKKSPEFKKMVRVYSAFDSLNEPITKRLYPDDIQKLAVDLDALFQFGSKAFVAAGLSVLERHLPQAQSSDRYQLNLHELFLRPEIVEGLRLAKARYPSLTERVDQIRNSSDAIYSLERAKPHEQLNSLVRDHLKANEPLRRLQCSRLFTSAN